MPFEGEFKLVHSTIFVIANERDINDLKRNKEKIYWIETIQVEHPMIGSHDKIELADFPKLSKITSDNDVHVHALYIENCMNLRHIDLSKDVEIHEMSLRYLSSLKEIRLEDKSSINTLILSEDIDGDVLLNIASRAIIWTLKWGDKTYKNVQASSALRYLKPVHGYTISQP